MSDIILLTKKAFRFTNPNISKFELQNAIDAQDKKKLEQSFVDVPAQTETAVPDWVQQDPMFTWGANDGDILIVSRPTTTAVAGASGQGGASEVKAGVTTEATSAAAGQGDAAKTQLQGGGAAPAPGTQTGEAKKADEAAKAAPATPAAAK